MSETHHPEFINLDEYFEKMSDQNEHPSAEVERNAAILLLHVNALVEDLFAREMLPLPYAIVLSSGWRTSAHNRKIGGSVHSNHISGCAVDLRGPDIAKILEKHPTLLTEHDLYMESPKDSPRHTHLQTVAPKSGKRIFRK